MKGMTPRWTWGPAIFVVILELVLATPVVYAVTPTSAEAFGISAQHRLVSDVKLPDGQRRLVLELSLLNSGGHVLNDVCVWLRSPGDMRLAPAADSPSTRPESPVRRIDTSPIGSPRTASQSRLRVLKPGTQQAITMELTLPPDSNRSRRIVGEELDWRIEATDSATHRTVAFGVSSEGEQP